MNPSAVDLDVHTVLVSGVGGMVGRAVADRLHAAGIRVVGVDVRPVLGLRYPVELHDLDGNSRWKNIIDSYGVDQVVHAGGISGPMVAPGDPRKVFRVNVDSLVDLLEVGRLRSLSRIVWFSSILAVGAQPDLASVDECTALRPKDVYGASKAAGEAMISGFHSEHGLDAVALRITSCYGPGRTTHCLIRQLVRDGQARRTTRIRDVAGLTRQHVYIDDVVDAVVSALAAAQLSQRAYNIGPGVAQSLAAIVEGVRQAVPAVRVVRDPAGFPWNVFPVGPLDTSAATRDFGYEARVGFAAGAAHLRAARVDR